MIRLKFQETRGHGWPVTHACRICRSLAIFNPSSFSYCSHLVFGRRSHPSELPWQTPSAPGFYVTMSDGFIPVTGKRLERDFDTCFCPSIYRDTRSPGCFERPTCPGYRHGRESHAATSK